MTFDPIALAQQAPDKATFDAAILGGLARSVGFDAAFLAALGEDATTVTIDGARLNVALRSDAYAREVAPMKRAALAKRGVAVDTEVLGEPRVRTLGYHRDFAAPIGGRHSLFGMLSLRGSLVGALMLGRAGRRFSDRELAIVEAVLPGIAIARASYHQPWHGAPLATAPSTAAHRLGEWLRGQRVLERVEDEKGVTLVVRDRGGCREMVAIDADGELVWSRAELENPERSGWFYVDLLHLAAVRAPRRGRFLFIGSGGGVGIRQFARAYPGARLDVVESDVRVVGLARRWFDLDSLPNLGVRIADGTDYLRHAASETWDAIVVDAYDGTALASNFTRRAFFADVRHALRPGGGLAFNVIGTLGGRSDVQQIEDAARAAGLEVRLVPVLDPGEDYAPLARRNVVVVARR